MGIIRTKVRLANPRHDQPQDLEVSALVDTGADVMCLPAELVLRLGLESDSSRIAATADGSYRSCRYVGPVRVRFENRTCYVGALELGDEVLLGAIPLEDMDLVVHPRLQAVTSNPAHPDGPYNTVK